MRGVVMHGPGDVSVEERERPQIVEPMDAIIRVPASCICGSDLWPYRGIAEMNGPTPMGHEYVGIVEEVGDDVSSIKPGQFVVGSFFASDNTCEICQAGYQTHCIQRQPGAATGAQSEFVRIPLADGALVATPGQPDPELHHCWPPQTCWESDGSLRWPPRLDPERRSPWLGTAPWACWRCWRPSSWAPSGLSR